MGIRYDRDSHRATNGPMFFFSLIKDETFAEEIRSAFLSGLSFYAYRFPHDKMLCYGSSEGFLEGIGEAGFVIGGFFPDQPYITIPYKTPASVQNSSLGSLYSMPERSTDFEEYKFEVESIIKEIKEKRCTKIVAARVVVEDSSTDIADAFFELNEAYPDAFVFCFGTPATGCWIGASPEILLESEGGELKSMALAGTRPVGTAEPWDKKNREEQEIVKDYIIETFRTNGYEVEEGETFTREAGTIEHICTPLTAISPSEKETGESNGNVDENRKLEKLLKALSPTPALCGFPKEFALKEIEKLEKFERGCYGGFCGPFRSAGDFHFNVTIRCASVSETKKCLYVGGGIVENSIVSKEWEETESKRIKLP